MSVWSFFDEGRFIFVFVLHPFLNSSGKSPFESHFENISSIPELRALAHYHLLQNEKRKHPPTMNPFQYRFKQPYSVRLILIITLLYLPLSIWSQATVQLTVISSDLSTNCTDNLSSPDIRWGIQVNGEAEVVYPATAFCFTALPNLQYSASYNCLADLPATLEVCLNAFEDDSFLCNLNNLECQESVCQTFSIPLPGTPQNDTIMLSDTLSTWGNVAFVIETADAFIGGQNDFPCDAFDLGELMPFATLGDTSLSNYNNLCSSNVNEPNPLSNGGFGNDNGVWFKFTTGAQPGVIVNVIGNNDPELVGDDISLQIAVYESSNDSCSGTFRLIQDAQDDTSYDETLRLECLEANRTYFILVDGRWIPSIGTVGYFGLEVHDRGGEQGPDFICDAYELGEVPMGGAVTVANQSNICGTNTGEPRPNAFVGQRTVWYRFTAPASGHVILDAISDLPPPQGIDDIDLQIAVFQTSTDDCLGTISEVDSRYQSGNLDETLTLECLEPGRSYWILIDGAGRNTIGNFSIIATDGGDLPPHFNTQINEVLCDGQTLTVGDTTFSQSTTFQEIIIAANGCDSLVEGSVMIMPAITFSQDTTICFGTTLAVGTSVYDQTGFYTDVIPAANGCDSTIITNLILAPELSVDAVMIQEATAYLAPDGSAQAAAMGGDGNYTYSWPNGQTTATATNLNGGQSYCVTVTDGNGCTAEDCALIFFPSNILVLVEGDTLDCNGDTNGDLIISIANGAWPYDYNWESSDGSLSGNGMVTTEGGNSTITNLPAGNYSFTISDGFGLAAAVGKIIEPAPILTPLDETLCFGETLQVGSVFYTTSGPINEVLISSKGCDSTVTGDLLILPLIASQLDETVCFGEGIIVGSTPYNSSGPINETLTAINGCDSIVTGMLSVLPEIRTDEVITLCFGESHAVGNTILDATDNYTTILTATNGCDSTVYTDLTIQQELNASAALSQEATALFTADGEATALVLGGSGNYNYLWSNGQTTATATNLEGGMTYCVTVTDDIGCEDESCIVILFPSNILHDVLNDTLDCIGNTNGEITFSVYNGQAPYNYAWQNIDNSLNGNGVIQTEGGSMTLSNLPPGNYTITITDPWGTTIINGSVKDPDPITIQPSSENPISCFGACDGELTMEAEGGTGPYQYLWSTNEPGNTLSNLCAGIYNLTVTDANNCTAEFTFPVDQPAQLMATVVEDLPVLCFGEATGQATVGLNGNPISWLWDNGELTQTAVGLEGGFHQVTVTNADGCVALGEVFIQAPAQALSSTITLASPISCYDAADGLLEVTAAGGTGFQYLWSNGDTSPMTQDLGEGKYFVTLTDGNGCTLIDSFDLFAPTPIATTLSIQDVTCRGGEFSGVVGVSSIQGGVGPYLFSLDGQSYTDQDTFMQLQSGAYEVYVQDAAGCVEIFDALVDDPDFVVLSLGEERDIFLGESILLQSQTNSTNALYEWTSSDTVSCAQCPSTSVRPVFTTAYTLTVTDSLTGCTATETIVVKVEKRRGVFIPNIFTPNADGINDRLMIETDESVAIIHNFRIFSRWGEPVFEVTNFMPNDQQYGWDGNWRGESASSGVYVFMAEIEFVDGESRVFKGDITLMR